MRWNQVMGILFLGIISGGSIAKADIVEIKDEGFVSGDIVSEDEKEMTFKDAHGVNRVIPKNKIGMVEHEDKLKKYKEMPAEIVKKITGVEKKVKDKADTTGKKIKKKASSPLDRSKAQGKADELSNAFAEANKAASAMAKKNAQVAKEMRAAEGGGIAEGSSSKKKGRFESL